MPIKMYQVPFLDSFVLESNVVDDELQILQDNINELQPKERIDLLIKLLPYVMPKVQTVSARDGEPIGADWMSI